MIQPVILAAGKGTRMQSDLPKCLHTVAGVPIARRILDTFKKAGTLPPLVVVGYKAPEVMQALGEQRYVLTEKIEGTADALRQALAHIEGNPAVLAVNGDHPFLRAQTVRMLEDAQAAPDSPLVMGTVAVSDFNNWRAAFARYGRIVRGADGRPERIVEYKNATEEEKLILEVNPNVFCADAQWLRGAAARIERNPVTGEYHINDLVALAALGGKRIAAVPMSDTEAFGANTPEDLAHAQLLAKEFVI